MAQKTFTISKQEQQLGSNLQTLATQHDLALAESTVFAAETTFEKARVELVRTVGATLDTYHVSLADARTGVVRAANR